MATTKITLTLPVELVENLRRVAGQRRQSRFVAEATQRAIDEIERHRLREELIQGYQANAGMDREMAEEWRPLEEEAIRTIDKSRVSRYWGRLSPETMKRVDRALTISLGLVPL